MGTSFGAPQSSLFDKCVLYAPLTDCAAISGGYNVYPILPSGVTITNAGTFTKSSLGNNQNVLIFDGNTNYITITDSADFYLGANPFSVFFWINVGSSSLTGNVGICGQIPSNGGVANTGWDIYLESGIPRWYWYNGTTTAGYSSTYGAITNATWYNFAFIGDGSTLKIYINSTQYGSVACTNVADSSLNFYLGGSQYWTDINGTLMHYGLWKGRALSQAEIKLLMNRTHPITGRGIMPANGDYWRLS